MEFGTLAVILTVGSAIGVHTLIRLLGLRRRKPFRRAWEDAARVVGLERVESTPRALTGRVDGLEVRLTHYDNSVTQGTRLTVSGLAPDLTVRPEGLRTSLDGLRGVKEIVVGDSAFDRAAWVRGHPTQVRAVLDHECRQALLTLFTGRLARSGALPLWARGHVSDGTLVLDVPESVQVRSSEEEPGVYLAGLHKLPDVLQATLALARRLRAPPDVARRLAETLATEPEADVRRRVLDALASEFPGHPATREALLAARDDPDAAVRVRAGVALGAEGRDVLLEAARGQGADDATTARAVEYLGLEMAPEEAVALLHNALRTRREATARACMDVLGRQGEETAVRALARVLSVEKGPLAEVAARELGFTGDPAAEPPLARALASAPEPVRVAAAQALGRVGRASAVAPLRAAEASSGELRRAARQAIAAIQSRLAGGAGASAGQLSLPQGETGQLSLAEDETGRLALSDDKS